VTESSPGASAVRWTPTTVRVRASSVLLVFTAVIAAVLVRNVFVSAHRTIAWAFATALLAVLLLPVVDRLARHMPRFLALVLTVLALAVISAGLWAGARSTIVREAEHLKERAPVAATTLEQKYSWAKQADLTGRVDSLVAHIQNPSTSQKVSRAAGTASAYFVPGILVLFLMVYGPKMVTGGLAQLPESRRAGASRLLSATVSDARAQILIAVTQACVVGLVIGGLSAAVGLEAPFLIGLVAGLFGIIPAVCIMLGSLPAILLATALASPGAGLLVLAAAVTLQVVQVAVVRPAMSRTVGEVGPALAVITVLLAYELYGVGGATYAFIGLIFAMAFVRRVGMARETGDPT
jgi:predicted PurR-regulated permease PerM